MMDRIRYLAWVSIGRACGFGAFAISLTMLSFIFAPAIAAKIGAGGAALMAAILLYKAFNAPRQPYRTTELWFMLDKNHGLPEAHAQRILMGVLRDWYMHFAKTAIGVSVGLWILGFILGWAGW